MDYPTQYPDCREELEAHYACVGAELWSCELFPLACSETAGALEVCLSGCSQGGVGELDAEGACACGGDLVGAAARSMTCEALDDGTGYACSCFADGTSVACVETDVSRVCDFTGGCCDFPPDGPAD